MTQALEFMNRFFDRIQHGDEKHRRWLQDECLKAVPELAAQLRAEVAALTQALDAMTKERNEAVAHDRQPYPTADAYERACAALATSRAEAERLRTELEATRTTVDDRTFELFAAQARVAEIEKAAKSVMDASPDMWGFGEWRRLGDTLRALSSSEPTPKPRVESECLAHHADQSGWREGCGDCNPEPMYPCATCPAMRTKAEGGTTFTVCDECWDKKHEDLGPLQYAAAPTLETEPKCVCGESNAGIMHRTDGPCHVLPKVEEPT